MIRKNTNMIRNIRYICNKHNRYYIHDDKLKFILCEIVWLIFFTALN